MKRRTLFSLLLAGILLLARPVLADDRDTAKAVALDAAITAITKSKGKLVTANPNSADVRTERRGTDAYQVRGTLITFESGSGKQEKYYFDALVNPRTEKATSIKVELRPYTPPTNNGDNGNGNGSDLSNRDIERRGRDAARNKIEGDDRNSGVRFSSSRVENAGRNEKRVRGSGTYKNNGRTRNFTFETRVNSRNGNINRVSYDANGSGNGGSGSNLSDDDLKTRGSNAVRTKISRDRSSVSQINFATKRIEDSGRNEKRVYGDGSFRQNGRTRNFSYEVFVNPNNGRTNRASYDLDGSSNNDDNGNGDSNLSDDEVKTKGSDAVQDKISRERNASDINFQTKKLEDAGDNRKRVSGEGNFRENGRTRNFTYEVIVNTGSGRTSRASYRIR